jgi:hypothetical protein
MRYVRAEMTSKTWRPFLLALLAVALIAGGCGGDDDSDDGGTTTAPTQSGAGSAAVEACVASATAVQGLSDEARSKIEEACEKSASGDPIDAFEASAEACRIIAEETTPEGRAREQALAACGTTTNDSGSP